MDGINLPTSLTEKTLPNFHYFFFGGGAATAKPSGILVPSKVILFLLPVRRIGTKEAVFLFPPNCLVHGHLLATRRFQSTKWNSLWHQLTVEPWNIIDGISNQFKKILPKTFV